MLVCSNNVRKNLDAEELRIAKQFGLCCPYCVQFKRPEEVDLEGFCKDCGTTIEHIDISEE